MRWNKRTLWLAAGQWMTCWQASAFPPTQLPSRAYIFIIYLLCMRALAKPFGCQQTHTLTHTHTHIKDGKSDTWGPAADQLQIWKSRWKVRADFALAAHLKCTRKGSGSPGWATQFTCADTLSPTTAQLPHHHPKIPTILPTYRGLSQNCHSNVINTGDGGLKWLNVEWRAGMGNF